MPRRAKAKSKTRERRQKRQAHVEANITELNLVPYLDVMVNIIMFLLLTVTSWVQFGVVNATLPFYGPATPTTGAEKKPDPTEEEKLDMTILVTDKGFTLAGRGGCLVCPPGGQCQVGPCGAGPTIPCATQPCRKPPGVETYNYNYARLTEAAAEVKKNFPKEDIITISGAPTVPYEVIVGVWDAVRGSRDKPLFHKVLFGPEVR